jgi:DNA invertase Pin-like site-specific DNA recombinase
MEVHKMNLDYSRLSRDEDKAHYTSIENQKKIIQRYAKEKGIEIDKSFEDDGYSGYTMDRPAFNEIMHLIDENRVDVLVAKDLSRLGRHNANVLLFLERAKAHGVRVILVDDNYDSATDSDDMIGIKTWMNERYVVEGSRKVRNALSIMQETAALTGQVPFGYIKDPFIKNKYDVDPEAALTVKKIFELYADGYGYMRVAKKLTEMGLPTPNMVFSQHKKEKGYTIV